MRRFHWLLLGALSLLLFSSPAQAGRLLFWRFESSQNRLVLTTDAGVQPRAQLIPNPTRLVIDLPGTTLGRQGVSQPIGGAISNVRVGQFDSQTTRLVIELAPGYTLDPQQIKIRGVSPTQWVVNLPTPQRISLPPPPSPQGNPSVNPSPRERTSLPPPPSPQGNPSVNPSPSGGFQAATGSDYVQVTQNGLYVRLDGKPNTSINVSRSRDRTRIDFDLIGIKLPPDLASRSIAVNQHGISTIEFSQKSAAPAVARLTLNVSKDSPDWQATFSRFGGLVMFPLGKIDALTP